MGDSILWEEEEERSGDGLVSAEHAFSLVSAIGIGVTANSLFCCSGTNIIIDAKEDTSIVTDNCFYLSCLLRAT